MVGPWRYAGAGQDRTHLVIPRVGWWSDLCRPASHLQNGKLQATETTPSENHVKLTLALSGGLSTALPQTAVCTEELDPH